MKKIIPFIYFAFAGFILIDGIRQYFSNLEIYRIIFSWTTESKYVFILVKILFTAVFVIGGIKRMNTEDH